MQSHMRRPTDLALEQTVTASGYYYTRSHELSDVDTAEEYSVWLSYSPATSAGTVNFTVTWEESFDRNHGFVTGGTLVSGTSVSGSFVILTANRSSECVISGTHGLSTGNYVKLPFMGNNKDWNRLKNDVFKITSVDANTIRLDGFDTSGYPQEYDTTTSGRAYKAYASITAFEPKTAPFVRFKISETGGTDSGKVNLRIAVR